MGNPLTEPAKLSSCWSKWHQTSYHQHCGHPRTTPKPQGICSVGYYAVYKKKIKDVGELRQLIVEEWEQLGQHVFDNVIRQWRRRLRGCVDADGGQFEHSLWLTFWLPQWTLLSFLKCLTILYRLHCNLFSWLHCSLQRIFIIYSTKSTVSRICILWRIFAANFMQIGPLICGL